MHILIVEDEIGIANFLRQGLEEEDFKVTVSYSGDEAYELMTSNTYDLILLDWMLPGKSGLEICHDFRETNTTTPILFLTAKDTVEETIQALQSGANDFIKKPFHFDELLERIKIHFRGDLNKKTLRLGAIELNRSKNLVLKNGVEVSLTQKEFSLLEMLLKNKNKVCTRKDIIEKVWDIHFDYNTGVIDVFINALRKKLNLSEDDNYIQTVRGVGYMAKEL